MRKRVGQRLLEYEAVPDEIYIDSFLAAADSSLALINLTGAVLQSLARAS